MPTRHKFEKVMISKMAVRKERMLKEVARNNKLIEGIVSMKDTAFRFNKGKRDFNEGINQYVKKFLDFPEPEQRFKTKVSTPKEDFTSMKTKT